MLEIKTLEIKDFKPQSNGPWIEWCYGDPGITREKLEYVSDTYQSDGLPLYCDVLSPTGEGLHEAIWGLKFTDGTIWLVTKGFTTDPVSMSVRRSALEFAYSETGAAIRDKTVRVEYTADENLLLRERIVDLTKCLRDVNCQLDQWRKGNG